MRITGLHAQRRHTGRANLHIDDEFHCGVAWDVVHEHGLRTGDEIETVLLDRLRHADECWKAKDSALSLLATRARARNELADRLRRKGCDAGAVTYALEEVERLGLIDDRAFAEAWTRDRLRGRPRGARSLVAELGRKGVDAGTARAAVDAVLAADGADEPELCRRAADKWRRTRGRRAATGDVEERRRMDRRLAAYLARRGFSGSDIRAVLNDSGESGREAR